jgi:hypothetical protein
MNPSQPMSEGEYLGRLEFRLCTEFAGLPERRHRYLWCDGIDPTAYLLDEPTPRIIGIAWIGSSPNVDRWEFTLLLPPSMRSRDQIDWASLLPSDDMTQWISFDESRRTIEIEPAAAQPDLE